MLRVWRLFSYYYSLNLQPDEFESSINHVSKSAEWKTGNGKCSTLWGDLAISFDLSNGYMCHSESFPKPSLSHSLVRMRACIFVFDLFWIDIEPDVPNIKWLSWDLWAIEPQKGWRFTLNLSFFSHSLSVSPFILLSLLLVCCYFRCEAKEPQESHQAKNEHLRTISSFISKFEDNWLKLCCNPIRSGHIIKFSENNWWSIVCIFSRVEISQHIQIYYRSKMLWVGRGQEKFDSHVNV